MKHHLIALSLLLGTGFPVLAQDAAPLEDVPIENEAIEDVPVPIAPAPTAAPVAPPVVTPSAPANGETITIPRAVWEQLLRDVEELKKTRPASGAAAPVDAATGATGTSTGTSAPGSRNYLLLPDISFILDSKGLASSDKRDGGRNTVDIEGEIGIQGYVYPNVKADAFIVGNPGGDEAFGLEEGYLTLLGAQKNLNVQIGRKFAPFGRTGELHPHSWLYSRQILARQNLVAGEALVGNGVNLNYLLPTGKGLFARLSLGAFSGGESAAGRLNTADPSDPFEGGEVTRVGAGLSRFYNARLWAGKSLSDKDELEFGLSHARGRAFIENFSGVGDDGSEIVDEAAGKLHLSSADISFRRFLGNNKRLLARAEYFRYSPKGLPTSKSSGYYGLLNYRFNKYQDVGLMYDSTDFPTAPGAREKALSLIYTKQFAERYYVRLMGTRGDRPGEGNYNELRLQFTAGLGPHTHELE